MKQFLNGSEISQLFPDEDEGGLTKEAHLVKKAGKKYVLRICKDMKTANLYELYSKKFKKYGFLPELLDKKGRRLIYEYIPGRDARKKDALKVAYSVGKIVGRISETYIPGQKPINFDERFYHELRYLIRKKAIDREKAVQIKKKYENIRKKVHLKNTFELVDPSPDNFRIYKGKVYLVDINAIQLDLKGRSFSKTFMKWFITKKQREEFKKGYNSVSSMKFLTKDYLELVYLYHLVKNIAFKLRGRRDYSHQFNRLTKLLKGRLK